MENPQETIVQQAPNAPSTLDGGAITELRALVAQNLAATRALEARLISIQRWIFWQRVWGWVKFALIVVPLVLGALYLPGILRDILAPYQELFQSQGSNSSYLQLFLNRK